MIDMIDGRPADLDLIEPVEILKSEIPFVEDLKKYMQQPGAITKTIRKNEVPIGVVGSFFVSPEVILVWSWLSKEIKSHKRAFAKRCREALDFSITASKPKKVLMLVKDGYLKELKFAQHLGFIEKVDDVTGRDGLQYQIMLRRIN